MEKPPSPSISWLSTLNANTKTKGAKYFAYAVYGMDLPISRTFKEYRKRFGIESSYKLMNQARARTSTKKTRPTTTIRRIKPPTGQHLDLHTNGHVSAYPEEEAANHEPGPSKTMLRQITRKTEEKLGFQDGIPI